MSDNLHDLSLSGMLKTQREEYEARIEALQNEINENEGVVKVWRRRCQDAEAERDAAVLAEREACARTVEQIRDERCATCGHPRSNHHYRHPFVATGGTIDAAAAIRARSNK